MSGQTIDTETLQKLLTMQDELISAEPDLGTLMNLVAVYSQQLAGAEGAAVELGEGSEMVYRAVSGMAGRQLGLRIPRSGSFSGLCADSGQALSCVDSELDDRVNREACRAVGLRSMVVQPLFHHDAVIGIVKVMAGRPAAFSEETLAILNRLSRTVAGVLANALRFNELKSHNENLSHLASHDAMTGIKNRSAFYDQLRQSIALAKRSGTKVGVALFDLDGLKSVNDTYGHQAGDVFIRTFAQRLAQRARATDTVARLGGDEFGALFPLVSETDAQNLGRELANSAEGPLRYGDVELFLRSSTGVSVFADDGPDLETLVARADERLYFDKHARRRA